MIEPRTRGGPHPRRRRDRRGTRPAGAPLAVPLAALLVLIPAVAASTAAFGEEPRPPESPGLASAASAAPGGAGGAGTDSAAVSMTLDEALRRALAASPRLSGFDALRMAAGEGVRAASAQRTPVVDVSGGYTRSSHVPELTVALPQAAPAGQPPAFESRTIFPDIPDAWRARLGVSVPIYTSGRLSETIASARAEETASEQDLSAARNDLARETAQAFWRLIAAREDETTLTEAIAAYDAHLKQAHDREAAGLAARNEVLAVQLERDRAELARLEAASGATVANENLARLTGVPAGTVIAPVSGELPQGPSPSAGPESPERPAGGASTEPGEPGEPGDRPLDELLATALENRPERKALAARADAAAARARAIRAGRLPQASLTAGWDYANPNRRILPPRAEWDSTWDAGVGVSLTVFDGGRIAASAAQAEAQALALRRQQDDLDLGIRLELATRSAEWRTARAALAVAATSVASARENLRVARDRYAEGLIPSAELLDAETALLRAGLDRTTAFTRLRTAVADLQRALGR